MKETLQTRLHKRQLKPVNPVLYWILQRITDVLNLAVKPKFEYKAYPGKCDGPFILISNHASRNDYLFTAPACRPKRLNYVVGYNEFLRFPLSIVLKLANAVPKKNFVSDMYTIKQIMKIIRAGGNVCFMPEGMSSITGMCQPVMPGGGKLLKKLGVPVYYTRISGGYLTFTKHCLDQRNGRTEVLVDQMFTPEELKQLTVEEIEDRMNRLIAHDDYIWNKENQVKFNGKGKMARNLDTLLYMCPECGAMYEMECGDNHMTCKACGMRVDIDDRYNITYDLTAVDSSKEYFREADKLPKLVSDWTILERNKAAETVRKEGFTFSEHVRIGMLPEYRQLVGKATSIICGDGTLSLDKEGLHFRGTAYDKPYEFDLSPSAVPTFGMCTDISRFYTFAAGDFVEFYPDDNDVLRWDHLVEEMHRYCGGKWQNTEYRHNSDQ
ncbi:MAG: 1-acyl-sn-glycerol-3-phosphate acyltransferase [Clostridiales bacterium]|nr:1-acyl-sn-glycerol-3-phosphate acyltransferase [Candidatus Crickella caballi]